MGNGMMLLLMESPKPPRPFFRGKMKGTPKSRVGKKGVNSLVRQIAEAEVKRQGVT